MQYTKKKEAADAVEAVEAINAAKAPSFAGAVLENCTVASDFGRHSRLRRTEPEGTGHRAQGTGERAQGSGLRGKGKGK